nr:MAG TPA: hypothetical protein [Bacteriophage sp.]
MSSSSTLSESSFIGLASLIFPLSQRETGTILTKVSRKCGINARKPLVVLPWLHGRLFRY